MTETVDQTDDSKVETDVVVSESIAEEIESEQKVESDLNYSDDFTSSSTSSSLSTSADHNAVIKTTVLAKQKVPEVSAGDFKTDEAAEDDSSSIIDQPPRAEQKPQVAAAVKADEKDALVESICNALMNQLISDTGKVFAKKSKPEALKLSARETSASDDFVPVSPPSKSRIEKVPERISVPLSPRSSRPIQEMMLTTFDVGSDSSEGSRCRIFFNQAHFCC